MPRFFNPDLLPRYTSEKTEDISAIMPISLLPNEVNQLIARFLSTADRVRLSIVCHYFQILVKHMKDIPAPTFRDYTATPTISELDFWSGLEPLGDMIPLPDGRILQYDRLRNDDWLFSWLGYKDRLILHSANSRSSIVEKIAINIPICQTARVLAPIYDSRKQLAGALFFESMNEDMWATNSRKNLFRYNFSNQDKRVLLEDVTGIWIMKTTFSQTTILVKKDETDEFLAVYQLNHLDGSFRKDNDLSKLLSSVNGIEDINVKKIGILNDGTLIVDVGGELWSCRTNDKLNLTPNKFLGLEKRKLHEHIVYSFSILPDNEHLLVVLACYSDDGKRETGSYIFHQNDLSTPIKCISCPEKLYSQLRFTGLLQDIYVDEVGNIHYKYAAFCIKKSCYPELSEPKAEVGENPYKILALEGCTFESDNGDNDDSSSCVLS